MGPKNSLISSFFAPEPSQSSQNASVRASGSLDARETDVGSSSKRKIDGEEDGRASQTKSRRLSDTIEQPMSDARVPASQSSKLDAWQFNPGKAREALTMLSQGAQDSHRVSKRTQEQEDRHAAFSRRLLGTWEAQVERRLERQNGGADVTTRQEVDGEENAVDIVDDDMGSQEANAAAARVLSAFAANGSTHEAKSISQQTSSRKATESAIKYTPLEKQYLELREAYPGIMLCIEVGYKFKFYCEDARVASRELNVVCFLDKHLMSAMIPVHRLHIHVKKLVAAGYKVGIVRQTETRALKAASTNASKPFKRELSELYTASTYIDDIADQERGEKLQADVKSLVAIVEKDGGGTNAGEERVDIGIVAVQAMTGTIIYDSFNDGSMRSELETRLAHLDPVELVLPPKLSRQTEKLLAHIASQAKHSSTSVRVERVKDSIKLNDALGQLRDFYHHQGLNEANENEGEKIDVEQVMTVVAALPQLAVAALAIAIQHLSQFKLESVFRVAVNFTSFASRTEMLLTSNTLSNLEILENNTDYTEKGSLVWLLSASCLTTMGKRLLRRWISRPLTAADKLKERSQAVYSLAKGADCYRSYKLTALLRGLPDLEKGLARLNYGRASPNELVTILLALNRVTSEYEQEVRAEQSASIIANVISTLPKGRECVRNALADISLKKARENDKRDLFTDPDMYPDLRDTKELIDVVESELLEHLMEVRKTIKNPRLQYASVAGEDYLIEVMQGTKLSIPSEWLRINSTKKVVRYRSPQVMRLMKERDRLTETLDAQATAAFDDFTRRLCDDHYSLLRSIVQGLATLDALLSLSAIANLPGYCQAEILEADDAGKTIALEGFRHPMTESLSEDPYIENDLNLGPLSSDAAKGILLTGSNMGGKSSTVRAVALVVIMAQIGSFVPATRARLTIHDAVHTRMGASDQLAKGRSTMMVEVQETAEILRRATERSLVILDELGRGTSTHDGAALAYSVLVHLLNPIKDRCPLLLFITHFRTLASLCDKLPLRGMHMGYIDHGDSTITFLYRLRAGLAEKSFGIHCARIAGLSPEILDRAAHKAAELEANMDQHAEVRARTRVAQLVRRIFSTGGAKVTIARAAQPSIKDDIYLARLTGSIIGIEM